MNPELFTKLQQTVEQNLIDIDTHKQNGNHAIGFYCLYAPTELAVAANAIPLPLCGTRQVPIEAAEEHLPRNLCPLIKSSYGFAVSDTCPFFKFSDIIVADTTCDGKKKMFELMSEIKPVHVLQLPQQQNTDLFLDPWIIEIKTLKTRIEETCGKTITPEKIHSAIRLLNRERAAKKQLMDIAKAKPSPITGRQMIEILFKTGFFADKEQGIQLMNEIAEECHTRVLEGETPYTENTPRILLTGVPVGLGSDKVINILEDSGANVVAFESCSGYKQTFQVDESKDPIQALAEQYLSIPCSVMSPNPGRFELLDEMIKEFSVDGVVDLTWQACHTYNVEAFQVQKQVEDKYQLPYLHLETDYSESDTEQIRVRIEAFLEMI
jgi:benzoyl-CoA reductase/2-hydroxyglutaryl-CoA dehydratase subunit BcrC/BadD/HgdB